jgi:lysophospholipase L1-like esterase
MSQIRLKIIKRLALLSMGISTILFTSCLSERDYPASAGSVDEIFKADLARLKGKRIYFGHQSVGKNIMEGVALLLKESGDTGFAIANRDSGETLGVSGIMHARIGANTLPKGKCQAFGKFLSDTTVNGGGHFDLAVLKFCYVDVQDTTDIDGLLNYYKATLDSLHAKNPSLVIMHITVPLKAASEGRKPALLRYFGMGDMTDKDNIHRNQYNRKLVDTFKDAPIFDLAKLESTYPDGTRLSFQKSGNLNFRLIRALSSDGGHLNELGKRVIAKAFVHALAESIPVQ